MHDQTPSDRRTVSLRIVPREDLTRPYPRELPSGCVPVSHPPRDEESTVLFAVPEPPRG
jgi:hypothetical protein